MIHIDISTEDKKKELLILFKSFHKIGDIYRYFNISDSTKNVHYIRNIASEIGFDLETYRLKPQKYCLYCGCPIGSHQKKFCSRSCAASYNNTLRGPRSEETKEKIRSTLKSKHPLKKDNNRVKRDHKIQNTKCLICGASVQSRGAKTCSKECRDELVRRTNIENREKHYRYYLDHQDEFCRPNYTPKFKQEFIEEQGGVCAICGCKPEWNGKELVFVLDHIDGNASNNRRNNLRCICPNCDSQLDTYKSKNKHSTRRNYWKEKLLREAKEISNQ